ncbi:hypothetical protein ACJX0J_008644, partial [Zea mays]
VLPFYLFLEKSSILNLACNNEERKIMLMHTCKIVDLKNSSIGFWEVLLAAVLFTLVVYFGVSIGGLLFAVFDNMCLMFSPLLAIILIYVQCSLAARFSAVLALRKTEKTVITRRIITLARLNVFKHITIVVFYKVTIGFFREFG